MQESKNKIFVCLGNFGISYEQTVHNIGFEFFNYLLKKKLIVLKKSNERFLLAKCNQGFEFLILKDYINLSGTSLKREFPDLTVDQIICVYDDINLDEFKVLFSISRGTAGHNGVKNLETHFGKEFARLRIGMGKPQIGELLTIVDYVISKVKPTKIDTYNKIFEIIFSERKMLAIGNASGLYEKLEFLD